MRKILIKNTPHLFILILVLLIFNSWFGSQILTATDFPHLFKEGLREFSFSPFSWASTRLGEYNALFLFTHLPLAVFRKLASFLNFSWAERLVWFFPFLVFSFFSSLHLTKTLFFKNTFLFLGPSVFLFNTYILMIIGGGQMGLALSYSLAPFSLAVFLKLVNGGAHLKKAIILGLLLAIQVMFDPRMAYLTILIFFLYTLFGYYFTRQFNLGTLFLNFLVPFLIVIGFHLYWILPVALVRSSFLPQGFESPHWVEFLSFAQFSNSFSLLHPLWPENIFGKVSFMRPEFLGIPILVYSSLLFISSKFKVQSSKLQLKVKSDSNLTMKQCSNPPAGEAGEAILFFALLGLIGTFLAKGLNPPFGEIYLWLFNNFPGMNLFRDPTKFYTLVAISYSILIPYSTWKIYEWLRSRNKFSILNFQFSVKSKIFNFQNLFLLFVILYLLFLIRPAWMGELGGTFKAREVPKEYVVLKDFLSSQPEFFRTLWVPQKQRFGFYSNNHPALSANEFVSPNVCQPPLCGLADESKKPPKFDSAITPETEILDKVRDYSLSYFNHPGAPEVLAQMGVKYVIVPFDSEGEIFLRDRKYSEEEKEKYIQFLNTIPWLKKIDSCCYHDSNHGNRIVVYRTPSYQEHFYTIGEKVPALKWDMINPIKYRVEVENATQPFTLVFSETYDSLWQAKIDGEIISSEKIYDGLNSFLIDRRGNFNLIVEFSAQKYVWWGGVISLLTLATSIFLLLRKR